MIETLQSFVERLRVRGIDISPAETIDAVRAASAVGPEDKRRFRAALAMTLAKDLDSQRAFEDAFEEFFAAPARGTGTGGGGEARGGVEGRGSGGPRSEGFGARPSRARAEDEPPPPRGGGSRPPAERPEAKRPTAERPGAPRPARVRPADRVGLTVRQRRDGHRALRPEEIRKEVAKGDRAASTARPPRGAAREAAPRHRLARLLASERSQAESGREAARADAPEIRRRALDRPATTDEERRLAREIPRLLEEIRLRHSRRRHRAPRGRLWMKRAIRENLATGGVPFTIPRSEPRRNHPRVVLVVDVSWSAARAAGLFLMLALELLRHDRRTRVHLFVDRPVDATEALRSWLRRSGAGPRREEAGADARMADGAGGAGGSVAPSRTLPRARRPAVGAGLASPAGEVSFAAMLDSVRGIDPGAASDYGRTFYALGSGPLRTLGKDAVLVVLGDGRTNVYEPLPWAFEEIAERARRVIWLIPEARERWGTGDSALPQYLQFCDVAVEARDLEGLARGVRELARAL